MVLDDWQSGALPQVSTYMGNPLGAAAGVATLEVLQQMSPSDWAAVHARGQRLMEGLQNALSDAGVVVRFLNPSRPHPICS